MLDGRLSHEPVAWTAEQAMATASEPSDFRPELLSVREREVLDLAVDGRTDEQIAQALGLTVATVNSYWVRIRGKLGSLSRVELVVRALHAGYRDAQAGLVADVSRLEGLLAASDQGRARAESDLAASAGLSWHLLALHFAPEAALVVRAPGDVAYANLLAERLFHAEPGALVGCAVCDLMVPQGREDKRRRLRDFMEAGKPVRMVFGVEEPCYALATMARTSGRRSRVRGSTLRRGSWPCSRCASSWATWRRSCARCASRSSWRDGLGASPTLEAARSHDRRRYAPLARGARLARLDASRHGRLGVVSAYEDRSAPHRAA